MTINSYTGTYCIFINERRSFDYFYDINNSKSGPWEQSFGQLICPFCTSELWPSQSNRLNGIMGGWSSAFCGMQSLIYVPKSTVVSENPLKLEHGSVITTQISMYIHVFTSNTIWFSRIKWCFILQCTLVFSPFVDVIFTISSYSYLSISYTQYWFGSPHLAKETTMLFHTRNTIIYYPDNGIMRIVWI